MLYRPYYDRRYRRGPQRAGTTVAQDTDRKLYSRWAARWLANLVARFRLELVVGDHPQCHGRLGRPRIRGIPPYFGGAYSYRQGLPLLRRHAVEAEAAASRGNRGNRAAFGHRCADRPVIGSDRVANAIERDAHGGTGEAAEPDLHHPVANRIRRIIGKSRTGHHGHG